VSIDEIALKNVEVTSGGRTVRADAAFALQGSGLTIHRLTLAAEKTSVTVGGEISDLSGPVGRLTLKATGLDLPALAAFLSDFSGGAGLGAPPAGAGAPKSALDLTMTLDADRTTFGTLTVTNLTGQARVTPAAITVDPIRFGTFDGTYQGTLRLALGRTPAFRLKAKIADLDVAEAMAFAGNPGVLTGRAAATLDVTGRGTTADQVIASAAGAARFDVTNGTVARLGLVRTVVVATSGRSGSTRQASSGSEAFSKLGATFAIGSGVARTEDMRFESPDVLLTAVGTVRLDGQNVELSGPLQLSKELSDQAGRDLVRYTAKEGLVTVPVTVTGPVDNLKVSVGMTDLARRAITNKATEEIKKGVLGALKKIIKEPS
jgi:AsmA protein